MRPSFGRAGLALLAGAIGAVVVHLAAPSVITLEPGSRAWQRHVGGATPTGRVPERAVVRLPGLRRSDDGQMLLRLDRERTDLRVAVDGGEFHTVRTSREGDVVIALPRRPVPSARLDLAPVASAPPLQVRSVMVTAAPAPIWPTALAFLVAVVAAAKISFASGLASAALLAFARLGAPSSWIFPLLLLAASMLLGRRSRAYWKFLAAAAAIVFGFSARIYFLPSAGSWDTEYWKAWMTRAVEHGTTRVYGDADAVPEGEFFEQLHGRTDPWKTTYRGREFVVDYPPLAMEIWRSSWLAVSVLAPGLERGEAENVAVKLPPVLGDIIAAALLFWAFRRERARAITLALLYWALPISWLSSGVLGFLDGAYAPFAVGALLTAAARRAGWTGVLVAIAALIKPQAVIVAPAAAVALGSSAAIGRAVACGLGTVGIALVPFAIAGTLDEAIVHVFRILFQQRLSAGYANSWWLLGHFISNEAYPPLDAMPFPASLVALPAFALATMFICWRAKDTCLAGGGLIFAYAMLALGVHHNHPHVMFLAFAATGLRTRRDAWFAGILGASYLLNMLSLSGLGRFYGPRYMAIEPLSTAASGLRTALGFDLTLLLAVVNLALFVTFLASLRKHE